MKVWIVFDTDRMAHVDDSGGAFLFGVFASLESAFAACNEAQQVTWSNPLEDCYDGYFDNSEGMFTITGIDVKL